MSSWDEPMNKRTAIAMQTAIEEYRYWEGVSAEYEAKALDADKGTTQAEAAKDLAREYKLAFTAVRLVFSGFRGAYGVKSIDELAEIAAEVLEESERRIADLRTAR